MFYVAHANINFCPGGKLKCHDSNMHVDDCFEADKACVHNPTSALLFCTLYVIILKSEAKTTSFMDGEW